jgi:hypothetical protein
MTRVSEPVNDNLPAANDNLPAANDNRKRADYMARHMRWRRRHPGKNVRALLRDALVLVEARAASNSPEARAFIGAVRDLLEETHADQSGQAS